MTEPYFEEEEFTSQYSGQTILRILSLTKPYWTWVLGFLISISIVSLLDSYFTFLSKQIVDVAIVPGDLDALIDIITIYGLMILVQAAFVFAFIYTYIDYLAEKKVFSQCPVISLTMKPLFFCL